MCDTSASGVVHYFRHRLTNLSSSPNQVTLKSYVLLIHARRQLSFFFIVILTCTRWHFTWFFLKRGSFTVRSRQLFVLSRTTRSFPLFRSNAACNRTGRPLCPATPFTPTPVCITVARHARGAHAFIYTAITLASSELESTATRWCTIGPVTPVWPFKFCRLLITSSACTIVATVTFFFFCYANLD